MSDNEKLGIDATPIQICACAIGRLADFWDELSDLTGHGKGVFIEEVFGGIWRDDDKGEKFEAELDGWGEQPEEMRSLGLLQAVFICCAYACQSIKAEKEDNTNTAWRYAARCEYWLGIVIGAWSIRRDLDDPLKQFAKLGATARHAETRAMKEDVFNWLNKNMENFSSMDAAAQAIIKQQPIVFRTAREWVGEWKKLRSAGTP